MNNTDKEALAKQRMELNLSYPAEALDMAYDQGLDHAIAIVQDSWLGIDGDVMFKGKSTNEVFLHMLNEIKKLKSQPEKGTDPPPLTILPPMEGDESIL